MIKSLSLDSLPGWTTHVEMQFGRRLNLMTSESGIGPAYLLEATWALLSGERWRHGTTVPRGAEQIRIRAEYDKHPRMNQGDGGELSYRRGGGAWSQRAAGSATPLVYARGEGGFSAYLPEREIAPGSAFQVVPLATFSLSRDEVLDGHKDRAISDCEGLIRDWPYWFAARLPQADALESLLRSLSSPEIPLEVGPPRRVSLSDRRDHPTLKVLGRELIPSEWPAGVRRIASICYMAVWTIFNNRADARAKESPAATSLILLIDELESHLRPTWAKALVPALLRLPKSLAPFIAEAQVLVTTDSPDICRAATSAARTPLDRLYSVTLDAKTGQDLPLLNVTSLQMKTRGAVKS